MVNGWMLACPCPGPHLVPTGWKERLVRLKWTRSKNKSLKWDLYSCTAPWIEHPECSRFHSIIEQSLMHTYVLKESAGRNEIIESSPGHLQSIYSIHNNKGRIVSSDPTLYWTLLPSFKNTLYRTAMYRFVYFFLSPKKKNWTHMAAPVHSAASSPLPVAEDEK